MRYIFAVGLADGREIFLESLWVGISSGAHEINGMAYGQLYRFPAKQVTSIGTRLWKDSGHSLPPGTVPADTSLPPTNSALPEPIRAGITDDREDPALPQYRAVRAALPGKSRR